MLAEMGEQSTHDPRLLASQQSPCDEQVSSGKTGAEAPGARKIGGCDLGPISVRSTSPAAHSLEQIPERALQHQLLNQS